MNRLPLPPNHVALPPRPPQRCAFGCIAVLLAACGGASTAATTTDAGDDALDAASSDVAVADAPASESAGNAAPNGTVVSVGTTSFVIEDATGAQVTIDVVSGSTYQKTTIATASAATVGGYIAAMGTVSSGTLRAVDLAIVPTPPSFIPQADDESTPEGTVYFGKISSISSGAIAIDGGDAGTLTIDPSAATNITATVATDYSAITVGETVEINGPEVSATEYTGHQINIGLTPAVVGQFD